MLVSVIIPTFNRAENLRQMLESLEKATIPVTLRWEVIVVDNNSNDHTKNVVLDFIQRRTVPIVYLHEPRQGKPIALNTALRHAKGEIVAFTDDDCIVSTSWISSIADEFALDPTLGGLGGRVELFDALDHPMTIRTYKNSIPFSSPSQLFDLILGCNMAFRRRVFDIVGEFDPFVGPGALIGSGNDIDIIYRAFRKGCKMGYKPNVLVYHKHGRRDEAEIAAVKQRYRIGRGAFYCKYILKGDFDISKMAYREMVPLAKRTLKSLFTGDSGRESARQLAALARGAICRLKLTIIRPKG